VSRRPAAPAYEATDAPPAVGAIGLLVLAGLVVLGLSLAALLILAHGRAPVGVRIETHQPTPPAPQLEVAGGASLAEVRARGARRLQGYGWSDRGAGLAHIPIERAMQLTAQRGWADPEPAP
jgi:hypothetical protein